jgi:hypothetical protein
MSYLSSIHRTILIGITNWLIDLDDDAGYGQDAITQNKIT